ncbi:hypothetical protein ACFOLJ_20180 [Rugamonas sp. CCM 8940]|uniref:hypothetical protein n=1 Tax=Rugamonas sp. CCM 8940 TaxID=2765359 RepID=UPI0018F60813|nr:hypothetical protein [Rugamonas sp. CCM 8940]MBJ7313878.1 hypothetical protein [Rugamonas sp. CCM 8940]
MIDQAAESGFFVSARFVRAFAYAFACAFGAARAVPHIFRMQCCFDTNLIGKKRKKPSILLICILALCYDSRTLF